MALGDLMAAPLFSHSSSTTTIVMSHVDDYIMREDRDSGPRRDSEAAAAAAAVDSEPAVVTATSCVVYLPQTVVLCDFRHDGFEESVPLGPAESGPVSKWRPKDRMKTVCVALVLCLNIGVDPPDVIKISPCARMECWIEPYSMAASKALETIGKTLHAQYERWQPRARYKLQLDPTVEEVKKLCTNCRKNARSERVLFHYNGHGVPKPTTNGEIWVFNKSYTQYIPLPISDLDSWLKTPSIYVFDCSAAGMIVNTFIEIVSASQAGDIQFLDMRNPAKPYLTIHAHRGSLTALAIHRHAPVFASGSDNQIVKVFSLEGTPLSIIKYHPTFMGQKIGSIRSLSFHPYRLLLAAGAADACVSIYADDSYQAR